MLLLTIRKLLIFDVSRVNLWNKILTNTINGKLFVVIYKHAKSCVKLVDRSRLSFHVCQELDKAKTCHRCYMQYF